MTPAGRKTVDWTLDRNLDRVGRYAVGLAERIRDEDPREMFDDMQDFARRHPAKCAQIVMTLAALVDPSESPEVMAARVESITASRVEHVRLTGRKVS